MLLLIGIILILAGAGLIISLFVFEDTFFERMWVALLGLCLGVVFIMFGCAFIDSYLKTETQKEASRDECVYMNDSKQYERTTWVLSGKVMVPVTETVTEFRWDCNGEERWYNFYKY